MNLIQNICFRLQSAAAETLLPASIGTAAIILSLGVKTLCENTLLSNYVRPDPTMGYNDGVICATALTIAVTVAAAVYGFMNPRRPEEHPPFTQIMMSTL